MDVTFLAAAFSAWIISAYSTATNRCRIGGTLEQSDGTSWMAKTSLNMAAIAAELAQHDPIYEPMAVKYFEHFLNMAHAMTNMSGVGINLWDEQDQFFYDVIHLSSGENIPLKIHTMVGLTPLFAVLAFHPSQIFAPVDADRPTEMARIEAARPVQAGCIDDGSRQRRFALGGASA